jgi:hypothetical protein
VIVNLLDLHPEAPPGPYKSGDILPEEIPDASNNSTKPDTLEGGRSRIEIFECGTGHGALTLHLARAIHAANPRVPIPENKSDTEVSEEIATRLRKAERHAVIHTMDISEKHSRHAHEIVKGFRKGMYLNDITFHVGQPKDFFANRQEGETPFLSHAILDMPGSHEEMATVAPHLLFGGKLLLFVPSITQILDAQRTVRKHNLPLYLEKVLELGGGISGGREWSVKFVRSRAAMRGEAATAASSSTAAVAAADRKSAAVGSHIPTVKTLREAAVYALCLGDTDAQAAITLLPSEAGLTTLTSAVAYYTSIGDAGNEAALVRLQEKLESLNDGNKEIPGSQQHKKDEEDWLISCRPKPGKIVQGGGFIGLWTRIEARGEVGDVDTGFSKGLRDV